MTLISVYTNGRILSSEGIVDTVSVKDGRIFSLNNPVNESNKKIIDLEGKCVVPGFIDAHTHMLRLGLELNGLSLEDISDRGEVLRKVKDFSDRQDISIVVGYGWDESLWKSNDFLNADELSFTSKPVILYRRDGHMAVVNRAVLKSLHADGDSELRNGILKEEKMNLVKDMLKPDRPQIIRALNTAKEKAFSLGITGVRDIVDYDTEVAYTTMNSGKFHVSRAIYTEDFFGGFRRNMGRWGIKLFMDGSVGSLTAAHKGWAEENLKYSHSQFAAITDFYWKRGLPVAVHAIGEIAVRSAVEELARSPHQITNSIEHFELVEDDILEMIGDNTVISAQPNFLMWAGRDGMYEKNLGSEWLETNNPYREILDRGIRLAFGSDCMPMNPAFGIAKTVGSDFSRQRLSLIEAVEAYSSGSAGILGIDGTKGSIKKGLDADMAIFPEGFFNAGADLANSKPLETILGGNTVYRSEDNVS